MHRKNSLFESILDNISSDDNVKNSASTVASGNLFTDGKVRLEDGQEQWRYRLKVSLYSRNTFDRMSEKERDAELRDILDNIFASCRYVTEYEVCLVDEDIQGSWTNRSHIDVLFNSRKTTFTRMMRTLFIPVMRLYYENQNYRFSFIDLFGLQEPMNFYSGMWFQYMYSAVIGDKAFDRDKGGVYYEWLKLYNIATRKIHYDGKDDEVFTYFFDLLLYTVYKTKWIKRFRSMKRDLSGYSYFDVDVQIADRDAEGHINGTVRLLARDSFTMATKMMILRAIVSDYHWFAISEKHKNVIPLCDNSLKHPRLSTSVKWKVMNLMNGEDISSPYCYTSVVELFKAIDGSTVTREERLFAIQKFGCDTKFEFAF